MNRRQLFQNSISGIAGLILARRIKQPDVVVTPVAATAEPPPKEVASYTKGVAIGVLDENGNDLATFLAGKLTQYMFGSLSNRTGPGFFFSVENILFPGDLHDKFVTYVQENPKVHLKFYCYKTDKTYDMENVQVNSFGVTASSGVVMLTTSMTFWAKDFKEYDSCKGQKFMLRNINRWGKDHNA